MDPVYTIILPVFNESATLPHLYERLAPILGQLDGSCEVIFVDDGSSDASHVLVEDMVARDPRIKLIRLSRNFGHQIAISAGMDYARGQAVIIMDADLQDPPDVVLRLTQAWRQGYEVVYAVRQERLNEGVLKRWTASLFYRLLARLSEVPIPRDTGDFRLIDRKALLAFRSFRERNRFVRGLFSWAGFRQIGVPFVRQGRYAGVSKYSVGKMVQLAVTAMFGFSRLPQRLPFYATVFWGLVMLALPFCWFFGVLSGKEALFGEMLAGATATLSTLFGFALVYLGQIHDEAKARPLYFVQATRGVDVQPQVQRFVA